MFTPLSGISRKLRRKIIYTTGAYQKYQSIVLNQYGFIQILYTSHGKGSSVLEAFLQERPFTKPVSEKPMTNYSLKVFQNLPLPYSES